MEPIIMPIEDILDLHHFRPKEVPSLLTEYFIECRKAGIYSVRIIHGKGQGILKKMVLQQLEKNPVVISYKSAPAEAGGWGATIVELKRPSP